MATLGNFAADMIRQLGGKPTPQAQKLFGSWQQWEGGHTANAALWNPLNLTAPGSGLPTINEVGVVAMPNRQAGVRRTADLIESGYPALARAFRSGQVDFSDPGLQGDLNRWLSGKRTPGMTPYVSKIARSYGANVPLAATPAVRGGGLSPPSPTAVPQSPVFNPQAYAESVRRAFMGSGRMDLMQLPGMTAAAFSTPAAPGVSPSSAGVPSPTPGAAPLPRPNGKFLQLPTRWRSTHPTSGLEDRGYTHAVDIMGSAGTKVGAPVGGKIMRHGGAQGGEAMYFKGNDGRNYWIGHIANMLPVGTKVKRGQTIALISSDHPRPHVHLDYR